MSIRLIATDLDGTLLKNDHRTVPERSREALRLAAESGVLTAIASGRTAGLLRDVAAQVPQVRYAVISNGAAAVDLHTGERIFSRPIPYEKVCRMLAVLERFPNVVAEIYADGEDWVREKDRPVLAQRALQAGFWRDFTPVTHIVPHVEEELKGREVEKLSVSDMLPGQKEQILKALNAERELVVSSSIPDYMELNEKGVDKGDGLSRLCAALGIQPGETMALGDGDNDFELMDWAGFSVAMCSGLEATKARARYESFLSNEEGGVGDAIERFVLRPDLLPEDDAPLALAMAEYESGCPERIHHFTKVAAYAELIARAEGFPERTRRLAYIAGLVHDIGIRPALEKYGSCAGPYQEREGVAPARRLLSRLGYGVEAVERAAFLVSRHHTYAAVDGDDFQVLVEADFLVNMDENHMTRAQIEAAGRSFFRTKTGLRLLSLLTPETGA